MFLKQGWLDGTPLADSYAVATALLAAMLIAQGLQGRRLNSPAGLLAGVGLMAVGVAVGGSTVWFGPISPLNLGVLVAAAALLVFLRLRATRRAAA